MIVALAGGVGGAKLAHGLANTLSPGELAIFVNTGDDFVHLGLHISPDIDTVAYTLADLSDRERGWGLADETWAFMGALERLGGEVWFRLGDRDLATHVERTRRLATGETLSKIVADFCRRLAISHIVLPMSDDPVRTMVHSRGEILPFQEYFVHRACAPPVDGFTFEGADQAVVQPTLLASISDPALEAIIVCPSNPFVSIGPFLAMPPFSAALTQRRAPLIAVSPIIGGKALKGPAAKMFEELGLVPTVVSVAEHYGTLLDGFIIDSEDQVHEPALRSLGIKTLVTKTVMQDHADERWLAQEAVRFAHELRSGS